MKPTKIAKNRKGQKVLHIATTLVLTEQELADIEQTMTEEDMAFSKLLKKSVLDRIYGRV
jgi:hypothetical protein